MQFFYDDEMTDKAVQAYFGDCLRDGLTEQKPTRPETTRTHDEITLRSGAGVIATYRVVHDGGKDSVVRV